MCRGREEVWVWRQVTGKTCHGPGWALQPGKRWSRELEGLEEVGVVSPCGLQPSCCHQPWEQDFCPGRLYPSSGEKNRRIGRFCEG